jgi:hypothetical protein
MFSRTSTIATAPCSDCPASAPTLDRPCGAADALRRERAAPPNGLADHSGRSLNDRGGAEGRPFSRVEPLRGPMVSSLARRSLSRTSAPAPRPARSKSSDSMSDAVPAICFCHVVSRASSPSGMLHRALPAIARRQASERSKLDSRDQARRVPTYGPPRATATTGPPATR